MKQWFSFIFSKQFLKHAVLIVLALIVFILLFFKWTNIYTQHGKYITLNDLNELTFKQAQDVLDSKGLNYFIIDSVSPTAYNPDFLPTAVLRQDPAPNSKVKKGRTIYLWLNPSELPEYKVPCLMGNATLDEAYERLEQIGLKVGSITYKPMEELKYGNPILKMMIDSVEVECEDKARYGTQIDLIVGKKAGSNKVEIPKLLGKTLLEAEFSMNADLNFGTIIYDSIGLIDPENAIIYMQKPDFGGEAIRVGSTVDIWLIQDLPEDVANRLEQIKNDSLPPVIEEQEE